MKLIRAQTMLVAVVFLTGCAARKHTHITAFMQAEPEEAEALPPPPPAQPQATAPVNQPPPAVAAPEPEPEPTPVPAPKKKLKVKTARHMKARRTPRPPIEATRTIAPRETETPKERAERAAALLLLALMPIGVIGAVLLWKASKSGAKT